MKHFFVFLTFISCSISACSQKVDSIKGEVYMVIHSPEGNIKHPAIIAIGGSEGGLAFNQNVADSFNRRGFVFIRLAYFDTKNTQLPKTLEEIPLEYFEDALDTILKLPQVDTTKIGVLCISKGTEAGLHLASVRPEIKALAAHVPSHVYWYGLTEWKGSGKSSWTMNYKTVPFVPYGKPKGGWFTKNIAEYYEAGLEKCKDCEDKALIKVEKMKCHLLLTSGSDDKMWPSADMANKIMNRLEQNNYGYFKHHHQYQNAGHGIYRTPLAPNIYPEYLENLGGTKEGNIQAINHNWYNTINFFIKYLSN